jgi:hypothetical protein
MHSNSKYIRRFLLLVATLISLNIFAQQGTTGSWNVLHVKYKTSKNFYTFFEAQLRSLKFYDHFHYYEYKAGFTYRMHSNLSATLGAGSYQTFAEGGDFVRPKNNDEFRIWPQIQLTQNIGRVKIEQRYRAELRFTSNGYRNRFRYRLGLSYPFGKPVNDIRPYVLQASNELFFTDMEPYFERNRMLVALSRKLSATISIQIGYLHQFDYKINDETGRDFVQTGLFFDLGK